MNRGLTTDEIAREVAFDLPDGKYVNLGIGLPTRVASYILEGRDVILHSENGILGMAPLGAEELFDPDLIDAGKQGVSLRPGGSYVSHADSFAIIRGAHLHIAVMGAFQVSADGDLANWSNEQAVPGVGGAMDLAVGARTVFVMMRHVSRDGELKIVPELTLPVTGRGIVSRIYTELGIFELHDRTLVVTGMAGDCDLDTVAQQTGIPVRLADTCQQLPRSW